jgi:acyl-CoA thioester hydrolase
MPHLTPIRVHFRDLDPYAHVNHSVYVTWFEIGRTEALRDNGILLAGPHASGYQFVVSELEIRYRKAALADEMVQIYSSIIELRGASSRWQQRVLRDGEVLAEGTVRIGLVGPDGRVARMPEDMKAQLMPLMA